MVIIIIQKWKWWCDDDVDNGGYTYAAQLNHFLNHFTIYTIFDIHSCAIQDVNQIFECTNKREKRKTI